MYNNLKACCACLGNTATEHLKEVLSQNQDKRVPSLCLVFEPYQQWLLLSLTHKCSELTTELCGTCQVRQVRSQGSRNGAAMRQFEAWFLLYLEVKKRHKRFPLCWFCWVCVNLTKFLTPRRASCQPCYSLIQSVDRLGRQRDMRNDSAEIFQHQLTN